MKQLSAEQIIFFACLVAFLICAMFFNWQDRQWDEALEHYNKRLSDVEKYDSYYHDLLDEHHKKTSLPTTTGQ